MNYYLEAVYIRNYIIYKAVDEKRKHRAEGKGQSVKSFTFYEVNELVNGKRPE